LKKDAVYTYFIMILLYIVEIRIINIPLLGSRKTVSYLMVCGLIINLNFFIIVR
jgi:hypothetical protein